MLGETVLEDAPAGVKHEPDLAAFGLILHQRRETIPESDPLPRRQLPRRSRKRPPLQRGKPLVQRYTDAGRDAFATVPHALKLRRKYPCVVEYEHIAGPKQRRQIGNVQIRQFRRTARVDDEKTRRLARLEPASAILSSGSSNRTGRTRIFCS